MATTHFFTLPILWWIMGILCPLSSANAYNHYANPIIINSNEAFTMLPDFNPNAGFDQQLCNVTTTQLIGSSTGGLGLWSTESEAIVHPITGAVQNMTPGNCYIFVWTVTDGIDSETDDVQICIDEQPAVSAGVNQQTCDLSILLNGNTPTLGTGEWTEASNLGASIQNPNLNTTLVSNLQGGNIYQFVWSISNGLCTSRDTVSIVVDENILVVDAGENQELCNLNSTTLSGTTNLGTGAWSTTDPIATVDPILGIASGMVPGNCYSFQWFVVEGTCSAIDEVEVCVFEPVPTFAGPDQNICSNNTVLNANTPVLGTGTWSVITAGGSILIEDPSSPSTTISNLQGGFTYELAWTVANGACVAQDNITIVVDANPLEIDAGSNQQLCSVNTTTLTGSNNSGFGVWTTLSAASVNPITGQAFGMVPGNCYTFTWTVVDGTCVGEDEVEVCIDEPTFAFAGSDQQACAPTAQLSGNIPPIGFGEWTQVSGSPSIITEPNNPFSTVTNLEGSTLYEFVWTAMNGGCIDRDTVVLDVDANNIIADAGLDQMICGENSTTLIGTTNIGTGAWSTNEVGVTVSPISGLVSGMEVDNCYNFIWNVTDGTCTASDTVEVCVYAPPVAAVGGDIPVCATTATLIADIPTVGTGQWFVNPSEGVVIENPFSPSTTASNLEDDTNYELVWLVTNGGCTASDTLNILVDLELVLIEIQENASICDEETTTLGISHNIGAGLWSTDSDAIVNPVTGEVSGMQPGNCYNFVWTVTYGVCSQTSDVDICVDEFEEAAPAGNDQTICTNSTQMQAQSPSVSTGIWTVLSGGTAIFTDPTNPTTSVTNLEQGQYEMLWTISNNSCVSVDTVLIDVVLLEADAGADQIVCSDSTQLEGELPSQGVGQWSLISSPGALFDPNNPTTTVDLLQDNTSYEFVWTVTDGTCTTHDTVQISTNFNLITINAGENQQLCDASTSIVTGTTSAGIGVWSTTSTANIDPQTGLISNLENGNCYTFTYTVTNNYCILADEVEICVEDEPTANAGSDQTICSTTTELNANVPTVGTGIWTLSNGGNAIIDLPTDPNTSLSNLSDETTYELIWTVTNSFCTATDTVQVIVDYDLITVNAGENQELCGVTTTILNGTQSSGTGTWSTLSTANIDSNSGEVSNLVAGNCYIFTYSVTDGLCTLMDEVEVCVDEEPIANAGNDQVICDDETTMAANQPTVGEGLWTIIEGENAVFDANDPNTTLSNLQGGNNYTMVWTVVNGACIVQDTVEIIVDEKPIADAGNDQEVNFNATFLEGSTPSIGNGIWSLLSGNGAIIEEVNSPNSALSNLMDGVDYELVWTVTNGVCVDVDTVLIAVNYASISAGVNQLLCESSSTTLAGFSSTGTGVWSTNSLATIDPETGEVSGMVAGNCYVFTFSATNGLDSISDEVEVCVEEKPIADAGNDQIICDDETTMAANQPTIGVGTWTVIEGENVVFDANDPNTTLSNLQGENNYAMVWTVVNGACEVRDTVEIIVEEEPIADAGSDQQICGTATSLNANVPAIGVGRWELTQGSNLNFDALDAQTNVSGFIGGQTYEMTWVVTNGICEASSSILIEISTPSTLIDAGENQKLCAMEEAVLTANYEGGIGTWGTESGALIEEVHESTTVVSNLEAGNCYTFVWNLVEGACEATDEVEICVDEMPIAIAGTDQQICANIAQLAATPSSLAGNWEFVGGTGFPNSAVEFDENEYNTFVSGLEDGLTYEFMWVLSNGTCEPRDMVLIEVGTPSLEVDAGNNQSLCDVGESVLIGTASSGVGIWSTEGSATVHPLTGNVSGLTIGCQSFVWTVIDGACEAVDEVEICVAENPQADAGDAQVVCATSTQLKGVLMNGLEGHWEFVGGTDFPNPNVEFDSMDAETWVSGFEGDQSYEFVWMLTNGHCVDSDTVLVEVGPLPLVVDAGEDRRLCGGTETQLTAYMSSNTAVGKWSTQSSATIDPNTGYVSNMLPGNCYEFLLLATENGCLGGGKVEVCVDVPPIAFVGEDQEVCSNSTTLFANQAPSNGTGFWAILQGEGLVLDAQNPNTSVSNLQSGEVYQLVWTVTNGACSESDTLSIEVLPEIGESNNSIEQYAFEDLNQNGIKDEGELGIGGLPITLYDEEGLIVATKITDENGLFRFENIPNGNYFINAPLKTAEGADLLSPSLIALTVTTCGDLVAEGFPYFPDDCPTFEEFVCAEPMVPITVCPEFCFEGGYVIEEVLANYDCSINIDSNCVQYTALPLFVGDETLQIIACSTVDSLVCDTAYIYINVGDCKEDEENQTPIAVDDHESTPMDTPISIDVMDNDSHPNGENISIIAFTPPNNGTVELVDGELIYTPNSGFIGTDSFVYQICDDEQFCDEATVTITICADSLFLCTEPLTPVVICPQFCDLDSVDDLVITAAHTTYDCSLEINGNCVQYTALPLFAGTDTVEMIACNPLGMCDTAYAVIQVTGCGEGGETTEEVVTDIEVLEEIGDHALVIHSLSPIPTKGNLKLDFSSMEGVIELEIYSIEGKLVEQGHFQNFQSSRQVMDLDVSRFAAGTYILHLKNEQGTEVSRFVKY